MRTVRKLAPLVLALFGAVACASAPSGRPARQVLGETVRRVEEHFYLKDELGIAWRRQVREAHRSLAGEAGDERLVETVGTLLATLHASHTEFLSDEDQEYWALRSIFSGNIDGVPLWQPGAWLERFDGRWHVRNVFEGSPAAIAGWLPGDEIVAVDGKAPSPVTSFSRPGLVALRRHRGGPLWTVPLQPREESFPRTMLEASRRSARVYARQGRRIGYFHLWSGTHEELAKALLDAVTDMGPAVDAFVLDLRDGFGGADPSFLDPFYGDRPIFAGKLVALVNSGTRSGKEWLAHVLKTTKRATLVGERTAGYFLAGGIFPIEPRFLLYLAVDKPATLPPLEGRGVTADIVVAPAGPYGAGRDPQLEMALRIAAKK